MKLVRDHIPEIIKKDGRNPKIRLLDKEEYYECLKEKLTEEVNEFLNDENIEELCDIVEVVYALIDFYDIEIEEFERIRLAKKKQNGGFQKHILLEAIEMTES